MFAVVDIAGQQFKVSSGEKIYVNRLDEKEGSSIKIDKVLLINDTKKTTLGKPHINNASVTAKVVNHLKGEKVTVFKKKRRKGYKVKNGFRASLTEIEIIKISEKADKKKTTAKTKATKTSTAKTKATKTSTSETTAKKAAVTKKKVVKKVAAKKGTKATKK
ncbi:MAG: 50S ribosomal protein L21 [Flavobacteriales bacterium TMED84]|nr:MAG: 50S ribosomal protein L21 [Flavobacteriales bacterium TMED84]